MSRIAIIFLAGLLSQSALAANCGSRISAFNSYEDYDDNMNKEVGVSLFAPTEFSPHSAFEGLVVRKKEDPETHLEVEVRRKKGSPSKQTLALKDWDQKPGYRVAEDFDALESIGFEPGTYTLRLVLKGKVLCEDQPQQILSGD